MNVSTSHGIFKLFSYARDVDTSLGLDTSGGLDTSLGVDASVRADTSDLSKIKFTPFIAFGALACLGVGLVYYHYIYLPSTKPLLTRSSDASEGSNTLCKSGKPAEGPKKVSGGNSTISVVAKRAQKLGAEKLVKNSDNHPGYLAAGDHIGEEQSTTLKDHDPEVYLKWAVSLRRDEKKTIRGVEWGKRELYLEVIRLNPNQSDAYRKLANLLKDNDEVTIDGSKFRNRELYLKAISLNPEDGSAYRHVANLVQPSEEIELEDGSKLNRRQLYCRAIARSESDAKAYYGLATALAHGEKIKLSDQADSEELDQRDLYARAIDYNPSFAPAYNNLGALLSPDETVMIGTESYSAERLFVKAIEICPKMAFPYFHLAERLESVKSTIKVSGAARGKKFLYTKVIELDPGFVPAYCKLANVLIDTGAKRWKVGDKVMAPEDLFKEAIERDSDCYEAYHALGKVLERAQSLLLLNGREITKQGLFIEVIRINPQFSEAYSQLAATLENDRETVTLGDKRKLTKKQLIALSIGGTL